MNQPWQVMDDRRMFERFSSRFPVKFKDSRDDFGAAISLRNASAEGIRITTKEQLYINDSVILEVKLPDSETPMTLKGQVIWAKKVEPDLWDVGVKFHQISLVDMSRLYKYVVDFIPSS